MTNIEKWQGTVPNGINTELHMQPVQESVYNIPASALILALFVGVVIFTLTLKMGRKI